MTSVCEVASACNMSLLLLSFLSHTGVTAFCRCFVLVQPRKPEKLTGTLKINQTAFLCMPCISNVMFVNEVYVNHQWMYDLQCMYICTICNVYLY